MENFECKFCRKSISEERAKVRRSTCQKCEDQKANAYFENCPSEPDITKFEGYEAKDSKSVKVFQSKDTKGILDFIEQFVESLADDNGDASFFKLLHSPYTYEELQSVIADYFKDDEKREVTSASKAGEPLPNQMASLEDEDDEFVSYVHTQFPYCICWDKNDGEWKPLYAHADLPLNGSWKDQLTLKFEFTKHGNGYAIAIEDIEVM